MTGTIPKNAGSTPKIGSQKARALCRKPRRRFHFSGPSGFPVVSHGCQGRSRKFPKFVLDRTQTRRKLKVQGALFEIHVHGASSQTLTGEIALSEIRNVFAEVLISSERTELLQKSLRGTHFEATPTRFVVSLNFSRKSKWPRSEATASWF